MPYAAIQTTNDTYFSLKACETHQNFKQEEKNIFQKPKKSLVSLSEHHFPLLHLDMRYCNANYIIFVSLRKQSLFKVCELKV